MWWWKILLKNVRPFTSYSMVLETSEWLAHNHLLFILFIFWLCSKLFISDKNQSMSRSSGCFNLFKSLIDLTKRFFANLRHKFASLHYIGFVLKILMGSLLDCGFGDTKIFCGWVHWINSCDLMLSGRCWCFFKFSNGR